MFQIKWNAPICIERGSLKTRACLCLSLNVSRCTCKGNKGDGPSTVFALGSCYCPCDPLNDLLQHLHIKCTLWGTGHAKECKPYYTLAFIEVPTTSIAVASCIQVICIHYSNDRINDPIRPCMHARSREIVANRGQPTTQKQL